MSKGVLGRFFWKRFFCPVFHGVIEYFQKNQEKFQNSKSAQNWSPKCPNVFWTCFGAIFPIFLPSVPWSHRNFSKKSKKFQNSKIAQNCSQKFPNVFWACFGAIFPIFFAQCSMQGFSGFLDLKIWVQFSGLKIKSSVFRNNTQQTFSLHSRHCQYTQPHFRLSRLKIISSDSRTQKYEFSFLDLKKLNSVFRT